MRMERKKKKIWINIVVLFATVILFIILAELVFRAFFYEPEFTQTPENYINFWKHNISLRLENRDLDKDEKTFRIIVIGDSFTLGVGTQEGASIRDSAFPITLESLLNSNFNDYTYEILNFGIIGSTTLEHYYILKNIALDYDPDLVLLSVSGNDINFQAYNLDPFVYCGIKTSNKERFLYFLNNKLKLFSYIYSTVGSGGYKDYYLQRINPSDPLGARCVNSSLTRIKSLLSERKKPIFIVYIYELYALEPEPDKLFGEFEEEKNVKKELDFFHSIFESNNFKYVATYPFFMNLTYQEVFADDGYHFNAESNNRIARIIYNYMLKNQLIPSCGDADCSFKQVEVSFE